MSAVARFVVLACIFAIGAKLGIGHPGIVLCLFAGCVAASDFEVAT
jgi:hypothetical protein